MRLLIKLLMGKKTSTLLRSHRKLQITLGSELSFNRANVHLFAEL